MGKSLNIKCSSNVVFENKVKYNSLIKGYIILLICSLCLYLSIIQIKFTFCFDFLLSIYLKYFLYRNSILFCSFKSSIFSSDKLYKNILSKVDK